MQMAVLSVDLAYKRYSDMGVVVLEQRGKVSGGQVLKIPMAGQPVAAELAQYLDQIAVSRDIHVLLLDGPQGWKAADNGLRHSRRCERELNTPAKTGEPKSVKPANYTAFVMFSVAVYDALAARGWVRLSSVGSALQSGQRLLVESFPFSAWRALRIPPLPAKSKTQASHLRERLNALKRMFRLELAEVPTHDELQALVAGLAGLALERNDWAACTIAGVGPTLVESEWREGYIVNALAPLGGHCLTASCTQRRLFT